MSSYHLLLEFRDGKTGFSGNTGMVSVNQMQFKRSLLPSRPEPSYSCSLPSCTFDPPQTSEASMRRAVTLVRPGPPSFSQKIVLFSLCLLQYAKAMRDEAKYSSGHPLIRFGFVCLPGNTGVPTFTGTVKARSLEPCTTFLHLYHAHPILRK